MTTPVMRASIRIHTSDSDTDGEFVSLHVHAAEAAGAIAELHASVGGTRESRYALRRRDGRVYRVWCV